MAVSNAESALVDTTRALIDIPSVSEDEAAITLYLREHMASWLDVVYDDDSVLVYTHERRPDMPLITLAGHSDTVPIANNVPSTTKDGTIFGRGACDMKGALAVMLRLAARLGAPPPAADVAFLFFGREELPPNRSALVPALAACTPLHETDLAILMEPTGNAVEAGCMGNLNLRVTVEGKSAHTARPWLGVNAAHELIKQLAPLTTAEPNDVNIEGLVFREVANVTSIHGGIARNVLPNEMTADINVRYAPGRDPDSVAQQWQTSFGDARVDVVGNALPAPVVRSHPLVQALLQSGAGEVLAKQAWTNAADFAALGIPAVNFGPADHAYAHTADEQVTADALVHNYLTLLRLFGAQES